MSQEPDKKIVQPKQNPQSDPNIKTQQPKKTTQSASYRTTQTTSTKTLIMVFCQRCAATQVARNHAKSPLRGTLKPPQGGLAILAAALAAGQT